MKKEGEIMARAMNRMNNVAIPPYIRKELGISDNWVEKISPKQRKLTVKLANRFKDALRRLSNS